MDLKRISRITFAALFAVGVWSTGPGLRATPQLAMAQDATTNDVYQASYFDVSSSFTKSQQGYGGPGHSGGDGDALVRIVDTAGGVSPTDNRCANIYVFDDDQEMQECCSCPLSPDSLKTISVINDLTSNPQFASPLGVGVIKILTSNFTTPASCISGGNGVPGTAGSLTAANLTYGLDASSSHTESMASNNPGFVPPFGFVTSTSVEHFRFSVLDVAEFTQLTAICLNIELHASGRGICTCGIGS
jgi:hypothetical protein